MPSRDYPAVQGSPPDNAEIADAARPVRLAARAGGRRAVHGAGLPARGRPDPLDAGAGRGARPAGPRPRAARDRPRDRTAAARARRDGRDRGAGRARARGLAGARRARALPRRLGQADARDRPRARRAHARGAARRRPRPGACRRCRGSGRRRSASCAPRWRARCRPQPRSRCLLNRSRPLVESIAEALGGIAAGDPRRWRDASERLAVVVPRRPESVLDRFEALPQIVAVVERGDRRALGVTVEGVPVELVVAEPSRLGTELVRATGSPEWVAAHEPLPDAPDEEGVFAALGLPFVPPELREAGAPADDRPRRGGRDPRRPPLPLDLVGRQGDDPRDGPRRPRARLRVPRDLRPHGQRRRRPRARRRRRAAAGRGDRRRERGLAPFRVLRGTECDIRRDGSLDLPDDVLAELDWVQASVHARPARLARGADQARARGARLALRQLPQPSDRAADQPPAAERGRPRGRPRRGSPSRAARSR